MDLSNKNLMCFFRLDLCPQPGCSNECPHGHAKNKFGCQTCECAGQRTENINALRFQAIQYVKTELKDKLLQSERTA